MVRKSLQVQYTICTTKTMKKKKKHADTDHGISNFFNKSVFYMNFVYNFYDFFIRNILCTRLFYLGFCTYIGLFHKKAGVPVPVGCNSVTQEEQELWEDIESYPQHIARFCSK